MSAEAGRPRTWRPGWQKPSAWRPEWVGIKPGYPKSLEEWNQRRERARQRALELHRRGVFHRRGVPDGWAGRRDELAALREKCAQTARQAVDALEARGDLDGEDPRVAEALAFIASVVLDPTASASDRLNAARILLTFTKPRAAARQAVSVMGAEEYLAELLGRA
jgi:hypothetical protein